MLNINWYDATGVFISRDSAVGGSVIGTVDWKQLQGIVTVPSGATSARVEIRVESTGGTAWVDDVNLNLN